jgi:thiol-disulfide isomerase/thioredoxin
MGYKDIHPNELKNCDVILYHVSWCGHCINFEKTFSQLQDAINREKKGFRVVSIDIEKFPNIDLKYTEGKKIFSVPKLVVLHDGFSYEYKKNFTRMSAPEIAKDLSGGGCGLLGGEVVSAAPVIAGGAVPVEGGDLEGGKKKRKHTRKMKSRSKSKSPRRRHHKKHRMMGGSLEGVQTVEEAASILAGGADGDVPAELEGGDIDIEGGKKKRSRSRSSSRRGTASP